jgi:glutathione S-transferase
VRVTLISDSTRDQLKKESTMAHSNQNQIVLGYWAIRGLAEPSRLALHYSKTPYTDKFYVQGDGPEFSRDEWLSEKQKLGLGKMISNVRSSSDSSRLDFSNLPYLFDGELKITQSKAILFYLGRKFHLMGKTPTEEAHVMMLCEQAHDFRFTVNGAFYGPKGTSAEDRKAFFDTTVVDELTKFEDYFGKHHSKFAVGDHVTVADFQLFDYIDRARPIPEHQTLSQHRSRTATTKGIHR